MESATVVRLLKVRAVVDMLQALAKQPHVLAWQLHLCLEHTQRIHHQACIGPSNIEQRCSFPYLCVSRSSPLQYDELIGWGISDSMAVKCIKPWEIFSAGTDEKDIGMALELAWDLLRLDCDLVKVLTQMDTVYRYRYPQLYAANDNIT